MSKALNRLWHPTRNIDRLALFASPMDPCPTVGQVLAFDAAVSQNSLDGIIIAVSEHYPPATPPVVPYCSLPDRIILARALRHVVRVVTYVTEDDLDQLMAELKPAYHILRPSDKEKFRGGALGITPLFMAELEASNYRAELIKRIQHGQPG